MTNEILWYNNLSYEANGKAILGHFTMSVFEGERLGIVCMQGYEKDLLMQVLHGSIAPDAGSVYLDGRRVENYAELMRASHVIGESGSLVPSLTIGENIFVLRKHGSFKFFLNTRTVHTYTQEILDSLGIGLSAQEIVQNLSNFDRYAVELIKAYTSRVKAIFIDSATRHFAAPQQKILERLYDMLKQSGISLVFAATNADAIPFQCDRVVVYSHGKNLKTFSKGEFSPARYKHAMPA